MSAWEERYQRGETGWDRGGASPALSQLLEQLPAKARVMVPGCGHGHEVVALAKRGFVVTAIDIAPSPITHLREKLQQNNLQAELIHGDLFTYLPEHGFDAVYEQTCLCAIEPQQRKDYAALLHNWLKPDASLYAQFMQTGSAGGPPYHCDLLSMHVLFDDCRWQWPATEPALIPHRNGRFELAYRLRRI
ncbi:MAG: thiopurine S-methyltransferase [Zetaproteobacteria bacterium CG12_big_fil_rev_8_21_14_0_65_54_13]|nr:MAG: thiopurine S-methyltransferase [Zetaproteobacteria bacterium CG23_combo_of_CG06-09_8_20_14_all_54_7]PIW49611.1 MAG: thiopurine S-methyltransferase [Zetaproteobacteria bacterium CG12_big_fil_rev_8_21_14_0_65_54_13]PIX53729.1 MAG: thiopurine S-methyltransferase [Zetaproteobacteria bacterium CG_4_10_14_3_um_filter_54_28]PJA31176.1 MAG: thiopurine S-methyltransferase [Zetaproteobacteria bacterium CG_4_9_14_3_um_filter_54_145]